MKKFLACLILAPVILTGCQKIVEKPHIDNEFYCTANVVYGEFEGAGTLSKATDGSWCFAFNAPDSVSGIEARLVNDELSLSYKSFSFSLSKDLPIETVAETIFRSIDSASQNATKAVKNGDLTAIEGESELGKYIVMLNSQNALVSVDVPSIELSVKIDGYNSSNQQSAPSQATAEE